MSYSKREEIQKKREYQVVKSNEIVRKAKYNLSAIELKLLNFIVSKIKPTDTELQKYTFTVKEFCQVCGIDYTSGANYSYIKETIKRLRNKSFWIKDENGDEILLSWIQKAWIYNSKGKITVRLDDDMQKYLINLVSCYTQYTLLLTLPMKSNYSIRIYEILKSYLSGKEHVTKIFDLEELKELLGATNYKDFAGFRRKVLEIATKEINHYTDISISWTPIKDGKPVVKIIFDIQEKDAMDILAAGMNAEEQIEGQLSIADYYK